MNKNSSVSILIVSHNHADKIPKLIQSIEYQNYKEVYICDANSSDDTRNILNSSSFANHVLYKDTLEGFSKNNNDLIRHFDLNSMYYLLLNPDVYFDEDFLSVLLEIIQNDSAIGIVAPLTKYPNGEVQTTWKKYPSIFQVIKKRLGLRKASEEIQMPSGEIDWCLGSCMLIRKELMKDSKTLLDERYRLYCEDIDICFKARTNGYKVVGTDNAMIYHHLNELSSNNIFSKYNRWNIESIIKFLFKWNWKFILKK